jgi:hypothetical protein
MPGPGICPPGVCCRPTVVPNHPLCMGIQPTPCGLCVSCGYVLQLLWASGSLLMPWLGDWEHQNLAWWQEQQGAAVVPVLSLQQSACLRRCRPVSYVYGPAWHGGLIWKPLRPLVVSTTSGV